MAAALPQPFPEQTMSTPAPPGTDAANRTKVFVSYAHEDRPRTRQIVHALEQAGFEVAFDGMEVSL